MLPFVVIFFLAGSILVVVGRKFEREARTSSRWPVVAGRLEHCEVVELRSVRLDGDSSWQLQLRYSYVVGGVTYHSTRYAFGYGDGRDDAKHRQIADALKRSPQLSVHYDPARPAEAVISTEVQTNLTKLGYGSFVTGIVAALIWMATC